MIFLQGALSPYSASALADLTGQFKFRKLSPGMYTLIIAMPGHEEMRRTIDIGPSSSDQRGRIRQEFLFDAPASAHRATVSAGQLSVPEQARKEYRKADRQLEKRNIAAAIKHLTKAVELAPQFSAAWNHLGTIAYQTGEHAQAEGYFREALKLEPGSYPPLVNLGGALLALGRLQEALETNLQAIQTAPGDPLAHSQLGLTYLMLDRLEEAERHLRQAKALDAGHFSLPQLALAQIYRKRGAWAALEEELRDFLQQHPDAPQAEQVRESLNSLTRSASP